MVLVHPSVFFPSSLLPASFLHPCGRERPNERHNSEKKGAEVPPARTNARFLPAARWQQQQSSGIKSLHECLRTSIGLHASCTSRRFYPCILRWVKLLLLPPIFSLFLSLSLSLLLLPSPYSLVPRLLTPAPITPPPRFSHASTMLLPPHSNLWAITTISTMWIGFRSMLARGKRF